VQQTEKNSFDVARFNFLKVTWQAVNIFQSWLRIIRKCFLFFVNWLKVTEVAGLTRALEKINQICVDLIFHF